MSLRKMYVIKKNACYVIMKDVCQHVQQSQIESGVRVRVVSYLRYLGYCGDRGS